MPNNVHSGTHKYEERSRNNVENSPYLQSLPFSKKKHLSTLSNSLILCQSWRVERFHNKSLLSSNEWKCVTVAKWSNTLAGSCEGWENYMCSNRGREVWKYGRE